MRGFLSQKNSLSHYSRFWTSSGLCLPWLSSACLCRCGWSPWSGMRRGQLRPQYSSPRLGSCPMGRGWVEEGDPWYLSQTLQEFSLSNFELEELRKAGGLPLWRDTARPDRSVRAERGLSPSQTSPPWVKLLPSWAFGMGKGRMEWVVVQMTDSHGSYWALADFLGLLHL